MKLKDFLNVLDCNCIVAIEYFDGRGEEYRYFKGAAEEVPWIYADMYIDNEPNGSGSAVFVEKDDDKNEYVMVIFVREEE